MKNKIVLKRIFHRDRWRIAICFDYDEKLKEKVNSIPGVAFSGTRRCFYADNTEENLRMIIKTLKDEAEIDISSISLKQRSPKPGLEQPETAEVDNCSPQSEPSRDTGAGELLLPGTTREVICDDKETRAFMSIESNGQPGSVDFRISEKEGLLVIRFMGRYDPEWIGELRSYRGCTYDQKHKEWLLPWTKLTYDSLADYFTGRGVGVNVTKQVVSEELLSERKATGDEVRARSLGRKAVDGLELMGWFLDENRYSARTRESYMAVLEFFFRYFSPRDPMDISEEEISRFIYDFIIRLGYSAAYQNQMVSAIKIFYTIAGRVRLTGLFLFRRGYGVR
ncbi:MAG: phage integrase N-terminal SAM-like domain-containing protein [Bacteroidales bacterium]|nr:phage integrase N-terminal SAM-like domain-containing protein [Bacteroidales bacterium]